MISNKVNNINDWKKEGTIKNTKKVKSSTATSISLTNKTANQGLFNNNKTLKGFVELYDVYKSLGPLGVLDYLDYVWNNTTNDDASIRKLENNLLAVAVYFDFDQDWLNKYSICTSPFYWWFNDTNKHRPARNKDYMEMKYRYFRLYIVSLLDN